MIPAQGEDGQRHLLKRLTGFASAVLPGEHVGG